ncbi:hypothetical protein GIB67_022851, partial [Kingdonia uniflora]
MDIGDDIDIAYYNGIGAEGVMNALKSCPGQLNGNVFEMMRFCEALNQKWRDGGIARQFVVDDVLKYYKFKYVKDRKSGYLFSDPARPKFFDFESAGRPWCDHLVMARGNCMQVPGEPALELIYKNFSKKPNPKVVADTSSLFDIFFVAWKSAAEVLKVVVAGHAEYEAEKASLAEQLKEQTTLWKYSGIIFLGDDASPGSEQCPAPSVADDTTKEEVVRLRGKVIELEKALSRARDSINRTQQVHNKLEYERRLHKSNFDNTFKKLFEFQCRYGKIKIERDEVLRKESDRFALFQKSLKNKQLADESGKLECHRSLLFLTLYFEAEVDSERGLKEAYLELLTERGIVSDPAQ